MTADRAPDRVDALKREAARAAAARVEDGMVVGLGTGSTATHALTALAERMAEGLRFVGIPTSERTAVEARRLGIPLTDFQAHPRIDLTIDGADEVRPGDLALIKGRGGALLREKIVAAASDRMIVIVDGSKLVDRLGTKVPLPVEIVRFGGEATQRRIEALGAAVALRTAADGSSLVTDGGNHILDCTFGPIADPEDLQSRLLAIPGVIETGLFLGLATEVVVAEPAGLRVLHPAPQPGDRTDQLQDVPSVILVMGVSGSGKTTIAGMLAACRGWAFEDGDDFHPPANVEKMQRGEPLIDEDRLPWLQAIADWVDAARRDNQHGVIACSALKREYRRVLIGDRPDVRLVYLKGDKGLITRRQAARQGHFMPKSLMHSQFEVLEEPGPDEHPITVSVTHRPPEIVARILSALGLESCATIPVDGIAPAHAPAGGAGQKA